VTTASVEHQDLAIAMLASGTNAAGQELADAIADIGRAPSR
jgi:hypothetical protein